MPLPPPPPLHTSHALSFPPPDEGSVSSSSIQILSRAGSSRRVGFDDMDAGSNSHMDPADSRVLMPKPSDDFEEEKVNEYYSPQSPSDDRYSRRNRSSSLQDGSPRSREDMMYHRRRSNSYPESDNISMQEEPEEDETDTDAMGASDSSLPLDNQPVIFLGFQLPQWFSRAPSWNRMAACVVTRAPCFWCYGFRQREPTDRTILARMNLLCAFFGLFQLAAFMWLAIVTLAPGLVARTLDERQEITEDEEGTFVPLEGDIGSATFFEIVANLWNINGSIYGSGFFGGILALAGVLTVRAIRNVNLVGAVRYLWILMWVLPLEILFVIGMFDYFSVTDVWIRHWWRDSTFAWFRRQFCEPSDTFDNKCTPPERINVTAWCLDLYNATDCGRIRRRAQSDMEDFMISFYYVNAAWGLVLVILVRRPRRPYRMSHLN